MGMPDHMDSSSSQSNPPEIDRVVFGLSVVVIVVTSVLLFVLGEGASTPIKNTYDWITLNLGIFYQWASIAVVVFLFWLGFSRYGRVVLGREGEAPEFTLRSWTSMLFCAGIGAGLMYWSTIEWADYIKAPPFGVEPGSTEAIEWAASYGIFHWGITAWCIYCLPALAIAVPYYLKDNAQLRLSTSLSEFGWFSNVNSIPSRVTDLVFILALIGGSATSLGLVTPMIAAVVAKLTGLESSLTLEVAVLLLCMLVFGTSVFLGLHKGIQRLSNINIVGLLLLLTFVVLAGPTLFILRMGTDSLGFALQNTVRMVTWTDPIDRSGFIEGYTVFYWAWWIAYAPFVGLFVARISRGRTVREVIFGMSIFGSAGCALLYMVLGNYALYLELEGLLSVTTIIQEQDRYEAITQILASLPLAPLVLLAFAIVAVIFTATTYDSASYALASAATRSLHPGEEPARSHRAFWAFGLIVLPITLMYLVGKNDAAESQVVDGQQLVLSATMIVSVPLLLLGGPMACSLLCSLRNHVNSQENSND
jgi:BCCT family betaine/carnitine transporter